MALTGTGIQIGTASEFDAGIRYPRGMASNGTLLLLFDSSKGYNLAPSTGAAVQIGTLSSFDASESQLRSACWNGTNFVFYGNTRHRLYTYDPDAGSVTDLTGELSIQGSTNNPDIWGLAFLDGTYWALERNTDALYSINTTDNELVRVGTATDYGLTGSANLQAFTVYRGELIAVSNGLEQLVRFNKTTGIATVISPNGTVPDTGFEALVEHKGQLLGAGSQNDALFRLYDVLWDETLADLEIEEGASETWNLNDVSQDAESFSVQPGETLASWLNINGMNLIATNAPAVDADTIVSVPLRAQRVINSGQPNEATISEDKTININVANATPVITAPGAPTSLALTKTHNSMTARWGAPSNNGGEAPTRYDIHIDSGAWVDAGTDLTHTFENLDPNTEHTIEVAAVNSAGRGTPASDTERTDALPPPPPLTDAVLDISVNPQSVTAGGIATATFRFNKPVSGFTDSDVSVSAGATKGTLTDEGNNVWTLPVTAPSTGSGTVTVSVGADVVAPGNNANSVQFTYTAPPPMLTTPGAPTSLSLSSTHNSITANWGAPSNTGGENPSRYDIRIDGGGWIDTGLDLTRTFDSLSPNTEYTIDVAAVNSAGLGIPASGNPQRTEMPPVIVPDAPTGLKVDLKPTSAVIRWAAVDGIDGYEVSYAEGASPGTTWIATGASGTRFFVKGLKRGTQYTFGVRGRNSAGTGAGSRPVTQNTPIASLHNALFFKQCVNYLDNGGRVSEHGNPSNIIRAVADHDYKTFTTEKDLDINIAIGGNPTRVDAIFVKGQDIEEHSAEPTGGSGSGYSNRMVPSTIQNWEGTEVSTVVAGFQHDLYLLDSHFTATSVRLTFTGANARITEILLLEFGIEIDANSDFTEIATNFVDRTGVVHSDPSGGINYTPPLGGGRDRWQIDYAVKVVPGKTLLETPEEFLYWRSENRNHVHAQEFTRKPWRVFPAVFLGKSVPVRYRTDDKTGGEILSFRVSEQ